MLFVIYSKMKRPLKTRMELDYRIENDAGFLDRIASARAAIQSGDGIRLEDLEEALEKPPTKRKATRAKKRTGTV